MRNLLLRFSLLLLASQMLACSTDHDGNQTEQASNTDLQRIVSLGGEISETLVSLGLEDQIVAVDSTSTWPTSLRQLPDVGYLRQLNAEGVLALQPDLILASHEAGPTETLERWRTMGIDVQQISTGPEVETALNAIRALGKLLDREQQSLEIIERNRQQIALVANLDSPPRVMFVLSKAGNLPLVAGSGTKAHTMLTVAGGSNVAAAFTGYKPVSPEAIVELAPQVILVASHGLPSFGGEQALKNDSALRMTPAALNGYIRVVDSQLMLSMGPRLGDAVRILASTFNNYSRTQSQSVALGGE